MIIKATALIVFSALWMANIVSSIAPRHQPMLPKPPVDTASADLRKRDTTGQGTFEQLLDHSNPSLGTFSQAFWWNDEFYAGPGSPVVFFTPGELAATVYLSYLTNATLVGIIAEAIGGAVVLMEHRYWGQSSPFTVLTTENLTYLTLENSLKDITYFANNVELPFDPTGSSKPAVAPWVMSGRSYGGALSGWTNAVNPGTFWVNQASSAVVEAVGDFYEMFLSVQAGMPQNCSTDVSRVIDFIDDVLENGTKHEIQSLKDRFGLGGVVHNDDFASALENGPWLWQGNQFYTGYSAFYQWCDYVENMWPGSDQPEPGAEGVGLEKALAGYAKWSTEILVPMSCEGYGYWTGENNLACFDTYNSSSPFFTDLSVNNTINRQWQWLLCNEPLEWWQDGAPKGVPTIVSRLVDVAYWNRQCELYFPGGAYGIARGKTPDDVNAYTGGWNNVNTTRLTWTNGEFDTWRYATVSSPNRPGGPLQSTAQVPVHLIPGGIHGSDMVAENGLANAGVQQVIDAETAQIKAWVAEYYSS